MAHPITFAAFPLIAPNISGVTALGSSATGSQLPPRTSADAFPCGPKFSAAPRERLAEAWEGLLGRNPAQQLCHNWTRLLQLN